jgi:hypothetical protein
MRWCPSPRCWCCLWWRQPSYVAWRWRGPAPMPVPVVGQVLSGTGVTVGAIAATVAAYIGALLARARVETWVPWFGLLVGLLALTGALMFGAVIMLALAWSRSRRYVADSARSPAQETGALDDTAASLVEVGEMIGPRLPRLGRDWSPTASGWTRHCGPAG